MTIAVTVRPGSGGADGSDRKKTHYLALDGLRAIAILLVLTAQRVFPLRARRQHRRRYLLRP